MPSPADSLRRFDYPAARLTPPPGIGIVLSRRNHLAHSAAVSGRLQKFDLNVKYLTKFFRTECEDNTATPHTCIAASLL